MTSTTTPEPECEAGDDALSSSLWSGGRSRTWSTHLLVCDICGERSERAAAAMIAAARKATA